MSYLNMVGRPDVIATQPEDFIADAIQQDLAANSLVLSSGVNRVPLARGQARFPVQTLLPQAFFVAGEPVNPLAKPPTAGLKQTTRAAWANKYINVEELAVLVPVPDAVLEDSSFDIFGRLRPQIAAALGDAIDNAILFGTNKPTSWDMGDGSTANGIVQVAVAKTQIIRSAAPYATATHDWYGDIVAVGRKLADMGIPLTAFVGDSTLQWDLMGVRDTMGRPLFAAPDGSDGGLASILGRPFVYLDSGFWPTVTGANTGYFLIAGDWANSLMIGMRRDMTFEVFSEGVITDNTGAIVANLMQQDMKVLRVTMRLGATVANPVNRRALNKNLTANLYPFVAYGPAAT